MTAWCEKCGDGPIRGFYMHDKDKLRFRCICGHVWFQEPLTKRKNLVLSDLVKYVK